MVAPSGTSGPDAADGFPVTESVKDCCGRQRDFEVSLNATDGGYFLRAAEIGHGREGYEFAAHHPTSPHLALGTLRQRIAEGVATRYLVSESGGRRLGHDRAVGHVGYGCVVIDGEEVPLQEFVAMLQSYEGWRFELRISDPFDVT